MTSPHWKVMNDLSETITSFLLVRDILQSANNNPKMIEAAVTLLEHYIEVQDNAFTEAWNDVVRNGKTIQDMKYQAQYTDEELDSMCDAAETEQIYKNYRAAIDEWNKLNEKYKALEASHIELQDLFYKVDAELDELKVSYDKCRKDYHTVISKLKEATEARLELEHQLDEVREYDC